LAGLPARMYSPQFDARSRRLRLGLAASVSNGKD
jgi:hypothetical protein